MTYSIQWLALGTIVTFTGPATIEEMEQANQELESDGRLYDTHYYSIWDFTASTVVGVEGADLRRIIAGDIGVGTTKKAFQLAVVSSTTKMKELLADYAEIIGRFNPGWEIQLHSDIESAKKWVSINSQ